MNGRLFDLQMRLSLARARGVINAINRACERAVKVAIALLRRQTLGERA